MKAVIFIHVLYLILIKTYMVNGVSKCESKVELRAMLISCPPKDTGCEDDDLLSQAIKSEEYQFSQANNFESLKGEKEKGYSNAVKDCKRKLVITLKIRNFGKIPCDDEYIVVDHVFDPLTGGRGRLLSPVVIKLRQEQMSHLYGLQFQRVVNSDPFEEQKICSQTSSIRSQNPTCGIAMYDGKPIPFSEGFCCSCDPHVNAKRQMAATTREDSPLYPNYKMLYQRNPHLVRGRKAPIVDPSLLELRPSDTSADKKDDCNDFSDPLLCDKIPNYLLEHDRKVVCDRGDFLNELCKLQEDKYDAKPSSGKKQRRTEFEGKIKEKSEIRRSVKAKEVDFLKKRNLKAIVVEGDSVKDNLLKDAQGPDVILLKNFIKTLNVGQSTGAGSLSDNYSSVKGIRGKRENRNENKKLTLEEKLERFVNLKNHAANPRKRLLELSHKRRRKVENRCVSEQEPGSRTTQVPVFLRKKSLRCSPPKYFFSHDKLIIDPVDSVQIYGNSSCQPNEILYEEAKDRTFGFKEKNIEKHEGKMFTQEFFDGQKKNKDGKLILAKINPSGGKEGTERGHEESLKMPPFARGKERYSSLKGAEDHETKFEEADAHDEKRCDFGHFDDPSKKQKTNRLGCKCLRNFLRKYDSFEKGSRSQKIRNFFIAKGREKEKLRSEFIKNHKKLEEDFKKNDPVKFKSSKEKETKVEAADQERGEKKYKEEEKESKNLMKLKEPEQKPSELSNESEENSTISPSLVQGPCLSQKPQSKELNLKNGEAKDWMKYYKSGKGKEEMVKERKNFTNQYSHYSTYKSPKELIGNSDFSFEIIRQKYPSHNLNKPTMNGQTMYSSWLVNEPYNRKFYHLKNRKNLYPQNQTPRKYYFLGNKLSPNYMYPYKNGMSPLRKINNRYRYFKKREPEPEPVQEPEIEFYDSERLDLRPEPEYKIQMQKRPLRHRRFPEPGYVTHDDELTSYSQTFSPSYGAQRRRERHSELLRRFDNGYMKFGYRPEALGGSLRPRLEKVRNKRSTSFFFQPAKGFFKSEFDSRSPEDRIAHELETCLQGQGEKAKKSDKLTGRVSRQTSRQSTRLRRENVSSDENGIWGSQRVQDEVNCQVITLKQKTIKSALDKQRLIQSYLNAPDYVLEEVEAAVKQKRQTPFSNAVNFSESEAGHSCEQESQDMAHCMRYGDMWYSLYTIKKPLVSQTLGIQLFDKHFLWDGTSQWRDLTKGKMIRVGTFLPKAEDELPSISISFLGESTEKVESAIDPENYYLLIPSHVSSPSKANFYPQFDGGPAEYLLVPSKDVSRGGECNMVGTSFEAFAQQPDRCHQRKGSCLKRQPIDLWREDMEARIRGKRGKYFVENFGTVSNSSVKTFSNFSGEYLALEYYGDYTSTIEIEVKADSNAVVRKGSIAQIPLVYVDSTYPKKTRIILSVLNIGLTSSYFRPRLGDCPPDLDPAWCPLEGPLVIIPPQQRHDFKLDLSGVLPSRQILVSVQVLNQVNKKIATRKINIKRGDRCVCAFHCQCNCIGNSGDDRTCRRLSLKDYRKAGYAGSFPFRGGGSSGRQNILKNIYIVFVTASYVLLLLGVIKGILGIFIRRIGIVGVKIITGPRELCRYYEYELQSCSVLFDEYGFPVHPTTCQPVQIVPLWLETILNFFFFFLYPLRGLWFLLLSLSCCKVICCDCANCQSLEGQSEADQKSSHPLLSKGLNPTCVHYNLTTFNSKKFKQDEYLPYPAYKGDDDPLEEDDTEFVLQEMKRYRKE